MKNKLVLTMFAAAIFFVGCSNGDDKKSTGGSSEAENAIADKTVAGVSQKGPFVSGSTVTLYEVDGDNLVQTGKTFTGKVASNKGEFNISTSTWTPPMRCSKQKDTTGTKSPANVRQAR